MEPRSSNGHIPCQTNTVGAGLKPGHQSVLWDRSTQEGTPPQPGCFASRSAVFWKRAPMHTNYVDWHRQSAPAEGRVRQTEERVELLWNVIRVMATLTSNKKDNFYIKVRAVLCPWYNNRQRPQMLPNAGHSNAGQSVLRERSTR